MRIADIGTLQGEVLLFGGPYSNAPALRALLAEGARRGLAADHMICTGDIVAYGADASECLALMQAQGMPCIAGNCELQLAANAEDCGCGFDAGSTCDLLSAGWYAHARAACSAEDRAYMAGLPDVITFRHRGRRAAVIHGGVRDVARFLWPVSPRQAFEAELQALSAQIGPVDLVVAGHSGIPFQRQIGKTLWLNAGVIGMPPHDGAPQVRFSRLDASGGVHIHTLSYDHAQAAQNMQQAGLTQGYDAALTSGWWPSEDILPAQLRRAAQHPDDSGAAPLPA